MKVNFNILFIQLLILFSVLSGYSQNGCTDPLANNYNSSATVNDGSCTYDPANISPTSSTQLSNDLDENSGLILWDNELWTHQDGGNSTDIFNILVSDLSNFNTLNIPGITNVDWEDIAQDDNYVYIGDFGNNANGNRTDLKIYRITKASINLGTPIVDIINFSYSDQTDFSDQGGNNTDFDCEALIVTDSSIFLFTKEWISQETTIYSLPKTPGTHSAINMGSHDVNGLVTGATFLESKQLVVCSGYSQVLQPFVYLFYDFTGNDFFSGNKRKLNLNLPFHQVEGIASNDGINYFISNEFLNVSFITTQPQIHTLNLSDFLLDYLGYETSGNAVNFNDPIAWVPGTIPPTGSDIKIAHDLNLNNNYSANDVEINDNIQMTTISNFTLNTNTLSLGTNSHLVMESGSVLKVNADILNNGNITFKSNASGSAQFDEFSGTLSGSGEVTVERYIPPKRAFRLLSSPVTTTEFIFENWQQEGLNPPDPGYKANLGTHITGGDTLEGFDQSGTNNPSMFTFDNTSSDGNGDQTNDWVALTNTNNTKLTAGEPYYTMVRGDRSIDLTDNSSTPTPTTLVAKGDLHTGTLSPTLSATDGYYSLVANPYQAVLNYNDLIKTGLTDYIYVWDASISGVNGRGGYVTVELPLGTATEGEPPSPSSSDADQYIAPGMSFFVQNLEIGSGMPSGLTFIESAKATTENEVTVFDAYTNFYINSRLYKTADYQNGNTESDALGLRFNDSFSTIADDEDATKILNPVENYAVVNNGLRSIDKQSLPVIGDEIDLYVSNYEDTDYTLTFVMDNKPSGLGVFLKDNYLNTTTEVTTGFIYDYTVNENIPGSTAADRFSLMFDNTTLGTANNGFESHFRLYPNPVTKGKFSIKTPDLPGKVDLKISNLLGQILYAEELSVIENQVEVEAPNLSRGLYVLKLTQGKHSFQTKLIVK